MPRTPFQETEALLAVLDDEQEQAEQILATMSPVELRSFGRQVDMLGELIRTAARKTDTPMR